MAINDRVFIQRDDYMFIVTRENGDKRKYKAPDDDLRRAIPMEEVRDNIIGYIRKKHANKA